MTESKVTTINEQDEKLVGIESAPSSTSKKLPTVILVHGFGVTKEESGMFDTLVQALTDSGLLVYRFDFSGCGESEGDYSETSLTKLKNDLASILGFVREQRRVDTRKIGILAQSFGTSTTVALQPDIQCLVLMGSVAHPKDTLSKLFGNGYNPNAVSTRVKTDGKTTTVKPQFWKDFDNHHLLNSIQQIRCPILFIHGANDDKVPLSEMEVYFSNANEPKKKVILEGADHGLRPQRDTMHNVVTQWFQRYLTENQ